MSTDINAVCLTCKQYAHFGQRMAACVSFGYGSADLEGRAAAGEFMLQHLGGAHELRLMPTDDVPEDCTEVSHESLLDAEGAEVYRDYAAHELTVGVLPYGCVTASRLRRPATTATGISVLEAIGAYALEQRLVKLDAASLPLLQTRYRVNPLINHSKIVFSRQA